MLNNEKTLAGEVSIKALDKNQVSKRLKELPGWELKEGKLERVIQFKDFAQAMVFVNQLAELAEKENHHPDFSVFSWNKVKISLYTHDVNGLSEKDFILAAKISELLKI